MSCIRRHPAESNLERRKCWTAYDVTQLLSSRVMHDLSEDNVWRQRFFGSKHPGNATVKFYVGSAKPPIHGGRTRITAEQNLVVALVYFVAGLGYDGNDYRKRIQKRPFDRSSQKCELLFG